VYFDGCPCHMAHNAARKGGDQIAFVELLPVLDLLLRIYL